MGYRDNQTSASTCPRCGSSFDASSAIFLKTGELVCPPCHSKDMVESSPVNTFEGTRSRNAWLLGVHSNLEGGPGFRTSGSSNVYWMMRIGLVFVVLAVRVCLAHH